MIVRGITRPHLVAIARHQGMAVEYRGKGIALRPLGAHYRLDEEQRTTRYDFKTGKHEVYKAPIVCVHGHEAFIKAVLESHPAAEIETVVTTYKGLADFNARQPVIRERLREKYGESPCSCSH